MKKPLQNRLVLGSLFALTATALWSGNFIVARCLSNSIPPISLAFWRWTVAVIFLTPFAIHGLIKDWELLQKHFSYLLITSIFGVSIFNTLIYLAGQSTTAINLSLISITFPVFIIVISRFLYKEKITLKNALGILLVLFGVLLIISKGSLSILLQLSFAKGDLWMLLAAIIFAIYSILLKQKPNTIPILSFQYSSFILGLILLLPFYLFEFYTSEAVIYDSDSIISILYIGICASLLAFIFWNKSIALIGPSKSGMIYYTLPLFSGLLAYIILKESLGIIHILSAILIISGILISNSKHKK